MSEGSSSWVDEPAFEGVCPELSAYPALKEAYVTYMSSYDNGIINKEEKYLWPFITNTGR